MLNSENGNENAKGVENNVPAVSESKRTPTKSFSSYKYYLRIGGILFIIASSIAVLLAFVNGVTADKIKENNLKVMNASITDIFPACDSFKELDVETEAPANAVYAVYTGETPIGYCIYVSPKGFKSGIEMMVGTDMSGACAGVRIISQSETPGLGSRVADSEYLKSYAGLSPDIAFGSKNKSGGKIDAVAGATVSSKAVLSGVNAALDTVGNIISGTVGTAVQKGADK